MQDLLLGLIAINVLRVGGEKRCSCVTSYNRAEYMGCIP